MMWAVSEGSSESECDATSDSADVESLSWDNSEDLYRLYYDDDENSNNGPIKFPDEDEESSPRKSETSFNLNVNILEKRASSKMIQCAPKTGSPVPVTSSDEEEDASLGFTELYWALLGALIGVIAFSH